MTDQRARGSGSFEQSLFREAWAGLEVYGMQLRVLHRVPSEHRRFPDRARPRGPGVSG
ncbi:hypothetical protein ABZY10_05735 [Streptomyces sp. NPDC006539]|uniref:hypothetical protein n=1 Tax=unclassified Streptomyces TaxID=2593676 RepID=UPI0033A1A524